jgi:argininosuccinate synthase
MKRIVLAYTGGLETSIAIPWLVEHGSATGGEGVRSKAEVVAVVVDCGRRPGLVEIRERALALGAVRCHVVDAREDFGRRYVLPALQAGAFADRRSPQISALARPLIAKTIVDVARMEHAAAIAFGRGTPPDRAPLDVLARALDTSIEMIVPARIWSMSEPALAAYGKDHDVPAPPPAASDLEIAANLWGRAIMLSRAQSSSVGSLEHRFALTCAPEAAPGQPAYLEIEFAAGVPVRVNGIDMSLLEMFESLETIGGTHGVGRTDSIVGCGDEVEYREIAEAPAAVILSTAHRALETLVVQPALARVSNDLGREYAGVIESGAWFTDTRDALDAFSASIQPRLTGVIRLRLFKGDCRVVDGTSSPIEETAARVANTTR